LQFYRPGYVALARISFMARLRKPGINQTKNNKGQTIEATDMEKEIGEIFRTHDLFELWSDSTNEGLILFFGAKSEILYMNPKSRALLQKGAPPKHLFDLFEDDTAGRIFAGETVLVRVGNNKLNLDVVRKDQFGLVMINDVTHMETMQKKSDEIRQLNHSLQTIYEHYADDTIFIADGQGNVEFAGLGIHKTCGAPKDFFIGKNVRELEEEKYFYPSVTARILESRRPEVVRQRTRIGKELISVGSPILDEEGEIIKIISVTKDFSPQLKLGTMLSSAEKATSSGAREDESVAQFLSCNAKMLSLIEIARLVSSVNTTVLVTGETGVGKGVMVRFIYENGNRKNQPFVKINCGAISPNLIESELFGYERGSFTGANQEGKTGLLEAANGGTIFLDEIGELPPEQQVKLLQVLQEHTMTRVGGTETIDLDIKVIAASNKDLQKLVDAEKFREDLFYRLNVVPIHIPPLRERIDDIPLLIGHFVRTFNRLHGKEKQLSKEAFRCMCNYRWPGNVRELENAIERLVVTVQTPCIEIEDLPEQINGIRKKTPNGQIVLNKLIPLSDAIEELEKTLIGMALDKYGNGKKAAEALGVNQSTISRKMRYYNL
jgi:transcriptional regulator with PAS, ATPase and Fis domain